jgi:hypothetical protein
MEPAILFTDILEATVAMPDAKFHVMEDMLAVMRGEATIPASVAGSNSTRILV